MADDATTDDAPTGSAPTGSGTTGNGTAGSSSGGGRRPVTPAWTAPEGATTTRTWAPPDHDPIEVTASAGWTVLRRDESPAAEVFAVSWVATDAPPDRPVTFVFNGGPGASAAYLHVGAVGPRRVVLPDDGSLPRMPVRLVDNEASWLPLTDLVFVDPVGTGFSRRIPAAAGEGGADGADTTKGGKQADDQGYYGFASDLAAMREFIGRWLSDNGRWSAPVLVAGESYGGYRVARLARSLQEDEGVGLAGAILISPALELAPLTATDYGMEAFLDTLPTMAAGARHHGRLRADVPDDATDDDVMALAADFATGDYATFLARGTAMAAGDRDAVMARLADWTGLDPEVVGRVDGRVTITTWVREVLRDQRRVAGLYDVTQLTTDPFPDREPFGGADPTLMGLTPTFTMGVNQVLRGEIGIRTDRRYELLSLDVNEAWEVDEDVHALELPPGATDDLRYGLALNPHLQVLVVHGRHDLVTPVQASRRLRDQMRLAPEDVERVDLRAYAGGHMFYALAASRAAFATDAIDFIRRCVDPGAATG